MFIILLKIVLCSTFLIALYYVFLGREKMLKFNRFYLVVSLVFSYVVPFIVIKRTFPKPSNSPIVFEENVAQQFQVVKHQTHSFDWSNLLWIVCATISLFFLIRFILSIFKIIGLKGEELVFKGQKMKILEQEVVPFSFWKTMYINRKQFNHDFSSSIFVHEKAHISQLHTLDLMFVEVLKTFSWWNPALFLYKKAIISNHEFLADEEVLNNGFNKKAYQTLILNEISQESQLRLSHAFNINNTKKRFIMMNTKKSHFLGIKKALSLGILVPAFFLLVNKTYATEKKLNNELSISVKDSYEKDFSKVIVSDTVKKNTIKVSNLEKVPPPPPPKEIVDKINAKRAAEEKAKHGANYVPAPPSPPRPEDVDTNAEYPGGLNLMRSKVQQTFDTSKMRNSEGLFKTQLSFFVDEKGQASDYNVEGDNPVFNEEALKAFRLANNDVVWKPATKDGKPVRFRFRMPLTMQFEGPAKAK